MSSWKARLLIMLTMLAMLVSVSAAPALATHVDGVSDDDFSVFGDDNGDDNGINNNDDEDVDVDVDRFGPRCALITVEEEDEDVNVFGLTEEDEDVDVFWVCRPSLLHPAVFEEVI